MKTKSLRTTLLVAGTLLAALNGLNCQSSVIPATFSVPGSPGIAPAQSFRAVAYGNGFAAAVTGDGELMFCGHGVGWDKVKLPCHTFLRSVAFANGLFVAVGGSYVDVPGLILTTRDGKTWTRRASKNKINLYGITYGNGLFVAVGDADTILTSRDGKSWRAQCTPTADVLLAAVAYSIGTFVVVGDSGTILTSANGIRWRHQNSGISAHLNAVHVSSGGFVAAASELAWTSADGAAWTQCSTPIAN